MRVAVIQNPENQRAEAICQAMARGISAVGGDVIVNQLEHYYNGPDCDVAVFYGLKGKLRQAFQDYRRTKKVVYVDLGYWGRVEGGRRSGYHKISVNDRHPTKYFQNRKHKPDRAMTLGIYPKPWQRDGRHILVAGMGAKAAQVEGLVPEAWESKAVEELRKYTNRPIVYRPKPSWAAPQGIEGTIFSSKAQELEDILVDCHAVVTHHSNVAVDGLVAGVPSYCFYGVAKPMSSQDLAKIEEPFYPEGRDQWIADIAYCQWNVAEMAEGLPWRHLKDEGLIP